MIWRCAAGVVLGLPLSIAVIAAVPGSSEGVIVPLLVLFFPLWIGVMAAAFLFRSGLRAWGWLGVGNLAAFALLWLARHQWPGL